MRFYSPGDAFPRASAREAWPRRPAPTSSGPGRFDWLRRPGLEGRVMRWVGGRRNTKPQPELSRCLKSRRGAEICASWLRSLAGPASGHCGLPTRHFRRRTPGPPPAPGAVRAAFALAGAADPLAPAPLSCPFPSDLVRVFARHRAPEASRTQRPGSRGPRESRWRADPPPAVFPGGRAAALPSRLQSVESARGRDRPPRNAHLATPASPPPSFRFETA